MSHCGHMLCSTSLRPGSCRLLGSLGWSWRCFVISALGVGAARKSALVHVRLTTALPKDHAPPKQFGPREDPNQLLEQVQSSLRV